MQATRRKASLGHLAVQCVLSISQSITDPPYLEEGHHLHPVAPMTTRSRRPSSSQDELGLSGHAKASRGSSMEPKVKPAVIIIN